MLLSSMAVMIEAARWPIRSRSRHAAGPDVLWRVWAEVSDTNLFLVAGGVTYAILLALFPGLAALISTYGLALDASQVEKQINVLTGVLPAETVQLLSEEVHQLSRPVLTATSVAGERLQQPRAPPDRATRRAYGP
jgi:uncharacterized BrkB/YihY/UPF0761 family membrane protein